ncbi:hypothetical protein TREES_T100014637 [Tupaia chinensis]|uniref:Uncharacterized protein n=1 Tax=Tupaia chinensis TaxID=246437 RepID=L9KX42_TUPCH|nr:hypothetical protein TREES_T100014637 [Tupaia chinensis]
MMNDQHRNSKHKPPVSQASTLNMKATYIRRRGSYDGEPKAPHRTALVTAEQPPAVTRSTSGHCATAQEEARGPASEHNIPTNRNQLRARLPPFNPSRVLFLAVQRVGSEIRAAQTLLWLPPALGSPATSAETPLCPLPRDGESFPTMYSSSSTSSSSTFPFIVSPHHGHQLSRVKGDTLRAAPKPEKISATLVVSGRSWEWHLGKRQPGGYSQAPR